MALIWPRFLAPEDVEPRLIAASRGGGRGVSGLEQIVGTDAGYWELDLISVPIMDTASVSTYHAIDTLLSGRSGEIDVPFFLHINQPWLLSGGVPIRSSAVVPFADGTFFDDGTGFAQSTIQIKLTTSAALRATTITVTVTNGTWSDLPGSFFTPIGMEDKRVYRIGKIVSSSGDDHTVTILPPLREALIAGCDLDFDNASCAMRLTKDDGMSTPLKLGKFGRPTIKFVEAF